MFKKLATLVLVLTLALPGWALAATPVNINTADAATLAKSLDGIGASKAQAIVAWREAHGPFKSADDLTQVKGFGAKTLERNRAFILLTGGSAAPTTPAAKADSKPAKSKSDSQKKSAPKTPAAAEE
jgi:competence protein ComEA